MLARTMFKGCPFACHRRWQPLCKSTSRDRDWTNEARANTIRTTKCPLGERRLAKRQGLDSRLDLDARKGMNCTDHTTAQRICSRQSRQFGRGKKHVVVASLDLRRSRARVRECDLMDVDKTRSLWTPKVYRHYRTVAGHSQVRLRRRELPSNSFIFASHETESSTILTTPTQDARSDE
jgi:hypothetical protein